MDPTLQRTAWYRKWWGIIIAILFLPFFIIWYIWAKTSWNKKVKSLATFIVAILMLVLGTTNNAAPQADTINNSKTSQSPITPKAIVTPASLLSPLPISTPSSLVSNTPTPISTVTTTPYANSPTQQSSSGVVKKSLAG